MRIARRLRRGFSLLEVLFAIALVLTCALIVSATMPFANIARNKAQLSDKAMDLAEKQMEAIRNGGFANATVSQLAANKLIDSTQAISTNTYSFTNSDAANLDNPAAVLPSGTGSVKVEQLGLALTRITIAVNWSESGTPRSFSVGTLVANL